MPVMSRVVEIRSYNLKPGTRQDFHRLMIDEALPLLRRKRVDVVAYGPSLHDDDSYYLIRAYDGVSERDESQHAFYGSDSWRKGPRAAVLALIDTYTSVVLELDDDIIQRLRR